MVLILLLLMDPSDLLWESRGEDYSFLKGSKADAQKYFKLLCLDALNSPHLCVSGCEHFEARTDVGHGCLGGFSEEFIQQS